MILDALIAENIASFLGADYGFIRIAVSLFPDFAEKMKGKYLIVSNCNRIIGYSVDTKKFIASDRNYVDQHGSLINTHALNGSCIKTYLGRFIYHDYCSRIRSVFDISYKRGYEMSMYKNYGCYGNLPINGYIFGHGDICIYVPEEHVHSNIGLINSLVTRKSIIRWHPSHKNDNINLRDIRKKLGLIIIKDGDFTMDPNIFY